MEFRKYNPPVFEGETTDPWVMEKWVGTMEKLFEDLLMEEDERVPLAVHFLSPPGVETGPGLANRSVTHTVSPV